MSTRDNSDSTASLKISALKLDPLERWVEGGGLQRPSDEVVRGGFSPLIQYLLSEDNVATNAIHILVVGESTVRSALHDFVLSK
jgi:hypothetical protein